MIYVFYGDDRVKALSEAERILGSEHETIDCGELDPQDLPTIFYGATLFSGMDGRRILLRDFLANKAVAGELVKYVDTKFVVVLLEAKVDKRAAVYKELAGAGVEFREFKLPEKRKFFGFEVYRVAKSDGVRAVRIVEEAREEEDPMLLFGALVSAAVKDFALRPNGVYERRVLTELSRVDMQMKSVAMEPWLLIEGMLLRMAK